MNSVSAQAEGRKRASAIDTAEMFASHVAGASLSELAGRYGVSVETIRQKLKKMGAIPHPKGAPAETRTCIDCGAAFKWFVSQEGGVRCVDCRGGNRWGKQTRRVVTQCAECGGTVERKLAEYEKRERQFCNSVCSGLWRSKHHRGPAHHQWTGGPAAKYARAEANPRLRLRRRISNQIWWALNGRKGGRKWETLVGFTLEQLQRHLERQFLPGMTWANYGEWHVDHIVPVSSFAFDSADDAEFKACFALSNLRPLWAFDNISKGSNRVLLL